MKIFTPKLKHRFESWLVFKQHFNSWLIYFPTF